MKSNDNEHHRLRERHAAILGPDPDPQLLRLVCDLEVAASMLGELPPNSAEVGLTGRDVAPETGRLEVGPPARSRSPLRWLPRHWKGADSTTRELDRRPRKPTMTELAGPLLVLLVLGAMFAQEANLAGNSTGNAPVQEAIVVYDHGALQRIEAGSERHEELLSAAEKVLAGVPDAGKPCDCSPHVRWVQSTANAFEVAYPAPGVEVPGHGTYTNVLIAVSPDEPGGRGEVFLGTTRGYTRHAPMGIRVGGHSGIDGRTEAELELLNTARSALGLPPAGNGTP